MAQVQHTPGPWELDIEEYGFRIRMGSAVPYTGIYEPQHVIEWDPGVYPSEDQDEADVDHRQYLEAEANMERIVAAVNAVEGIPTESLEAGVIRDLIDLMAEILRGLEWSGWDEEFLAPICPVCGAYKRKNKHFPDCDLNKVLSLLRGEA